MLGIALIGDAHAAGGVGAFREHMNGIRNRLTTGQAEQS